MKKNTIFLLLFLILAAAAAWLIYSKTSGTISKELRDFAVKDTAAVVKIFMADKSGQQVTLDRVDATDWILNGAYPARPDAIKTLLQTMHDLEVRSPIGKNGYNNVIKNIASKGIKVEVYTRDGLSKIYYVGGATQDQTGTFMYLENSTVPFVIHIPGFEGYLTPRYIVRAEDWKIKNVFRLKQGQLKSLKVVDRERQDYAFMILNDGTGTFSIMDGQNNKVPDVSQDKVISYLQFYGMVNYEMTEKSLNTFQIDSLNQTTPFRTIELTDVSEKVTTINLWRRPQLSTTTNKTNSEGVPYAYDIDRMIARIGKDTTLLVVQYYSFEKLFRSPADFLNTPSVK